MIEKKFFLIGLKFKVAVFGLLDPALEVLVTWLCLATEYVDEGNKTLRGQVLPGGLQGASLVCGIHQVMQLAP